ncbi:MAG: TetR family transcriptional regulator, partial [Actinobacteria bacterium]|nr:TetR family transcriptional regulator [Actinomycetota bacterium]
MIEARTTHLLASMSEPHLTVAMSSDTSAPVKDDLAPVTSRSTETIERRRRLVEAAVKLARSGGYEAVQMRDVASAADVALATLYRQYASKDQLLLAALANQTGILRDRLAQKPAQGDSPAERVIGVLALANKALSREPTLTAAMVTALGSPEPGAAAMKVEILEILRGILGDAGGLRPTDDGDAAFRTLGYVWFAALG